MLHSHDAAGRTPGSSPFHSSLGFPSAKGSWPGAFKRYWVASHASSGYKKGRSPYRKVPPVRVCWPRLAYPNMTVDVGLPSGVQLYVVCRCGPSQLGSQMHVCYCSRKTLQMALSSCLLSHPACASLTLSSATTGGVPELLRSTYFDHVGALSVSGTHGTFNITLAYMTAQLLSVSSTAGVKQCITG